MVKAPVVYPYNGIRHNNKKIDITYIIARELNRGNKATYYDSFHMVWSQ
jgi:hypothetical protein